MTYWLKPGDFQDDEQSLDPIWFAVGTEWVDRYAPAKIWTVRGHLHESNSAESPVIGVVFVACDEWTEWTFVLTPRTNSHYRMLPVIDGKIVDTLGAD